MGRGAHCPPTLKPQPSKTSLSPHPRSRRCPSPGPDQHLGQFQFRSSPPHHYQPGGASPRASPASSPSAVTPPSLCSTHVGLVSIPQTGRAFSHPGELSALQLFIGLTPAQLFRSRRHHFLREDCPKLPVQMESPWNTVSQHLSTFLHSTNCGPKDTGICVIIN